MPDPIDCGPRVVGAWNWRRAVIRSDLHATTKHVLLTLACHVSPAGDGCFPALNTLADECSRSRSTVKRHLREVRGQWIDKRPRKSETGRQTSNEYVLIAPRGEGVTGDPVPRGGGGHGRPGEGVTGGPPEGVTGDPLVSLKGSEEGTHVNGTLGLRTDSEDGAGPYPPASDLERNGSGYVYPGEFEEAWDAYPDRLGNNPKKGAYRKWRGLVTSGTPPGELLSAVRGYARFCLAEGVDGTPKVMMARTFFGPDEPWSQDWQGQAEAASEESGEDMFDRLAREWETA